jgi:hypothetical protein
VPAAIGRLLDKIITNGTIRNGTIIKNGTTIEGSEDTTNFRHIGRGFGMAQSDR